MNQSGPRETRTIETAVQGNTAEDHQEWRTQRDAGDWHEKDREDQKIYMFVFKYAGSDWESKHWKQKVAFVCFSEGWTRLK